MRVQQHTTTVDGKKAGVLRIDTENEAVTPAQAAEIFQAVGEYETDFAQPWVITGRAPIWAAQMAAHKLHPAQAVLQHDPRIGVVVVQSHNPGWVVGAVFEWKP